MGKVIQSVRGMVQGTLNRKRIEGPVMLQPNDAPTPPDEAMETFEKVVVSGLVRLKASVRDEHAFAAGKIEQAEQIIAGLRAKVAGLEVQLRESQETVQKNQAASQKTEESLASEIRNLQAAVQEKVAALQSRDAAIDDLKSQTALLQKQVSDLEAAIQQTKDAAAGEAHRAGQVIEELRGHISALESKLREAEDNAARKAAESQKLEERLEAELRELQNTVQQRDEALRGRDSHIEALQSKGDALAGQVSQLEAVVRETKDAAAREAQRAGQVILDLGAKAARLEAQLKTADESAQRKDAERQKMEESLAVEIGDLQTAVRQKEEALENRDSEISSLRCQTDVLAKQIADLESALKQAQETAESESEHTRQVIQDLRVEIATLQAQVRQKEHELAELRSIQAADRIQAQPVIGLGGEARDLTNGRKEAPPFSAEAGASARSQVQNLRTEDVAPSVAGAARSTLSQDDFIRLATEFSECANVIRSMASLILRHHVKSLGESIESFPRTRLPELLESLSREILDEKLKAGFLKRFGR